MKLVCRRPNLAGARRVVLRFAVVRLRVVLRFAVVRRYVDLRVAGVRLCFVGARLRMEVAAVLERLAARTERASVDIDFRSLVDADAGRGGRILLLAVRPPVLVVRTLPPPRPPLVGFLVITRGGALRVVAPMRGFFFIAAAEEAEPLLVFPDLQTLRAIGFGLGAAKLPRMTPPVVDWGWRAYEEEEEEEEEDLGEEEAREELAREEDARRLFWARRCSASFLRRMRSSYGTKFGTYVGPYEAADI